MQDKKPVTGTVEKIDPALQDVAETFDVEIEKPKCKRKTKHKKLTKKNQLAGSKD